MYLIGKSLQVQITDLNRLFFIFAINTFLEKHFHLGNRDIGFGMRKYGRIFIARLTLNAREKSVDHILDYFVQIQFVNANVIKNTISSLLSTCLYIHAHAYTHVQCFCDFATSVISINVTAIYLRCQYEPFIVDFVLL